MLKGIPSTISPELLKALDEMGHADTIVIGDSNFPATSLSKVKKHINIRLDGHMATTILDDILKLFPLDDFVEKPVKIMTDPAGRNEIHTEFINLIVKHDSRGVKAVEFVDRFDFYDMTKDAYVVVSTTDNRSYGCILLQKGCVK